MTIPMADRELATLRDEAAVRRVVESYADAIIRRDAATYGALYAPDAVWTIGPPVGEQVEGRDAIVRFLTDHIATMDLLIFTVTNIVISVEDGIAHSRATVHEFGRVADGSAVSVVNVRALYEDTLQRNGDSWWFTERKYSILFVDNGDAAAGQVFPTDA
jgi:ketosteroid isomerase-like protein